MAVAVRTLGEQIVGSCLRTGRRGVTNVERGQAPPPSRTVFDEEEGGRRVSCLKGEDYRGIWAFGGMKYLLRKRGVWGNVFVHSLLCQKPVQTSTVFKCKISLIHNFLA